MKYEIVWRETDPPQKYFIPFVCSADLFEPHRYIVMFRKRT